ncbi:MAG: Nif3-like dinuclear metal center hexameric protein [Anaerolineae bacterium]|nr:Nif3-like dinuclear metal center hexameric protein [Anaerolineae bacterium]
MVPTVADIVAYVEDLAGHPLNPDEGVQHGSPERQVRKVLLCWMATVSALNVAGEHGCDLVLTHESLYYPYDAIVRQDNPLGWEEWCTNRRRRELLQKYNLSLLRVHGSLDEICIFDDFAQQLGLGEPVAGEGIYKVYEIAPCTLAELAERVKARVGMAAVRVCAPRGMEQTVRRVGLPWGGLGLFVNVAYQQRLIEQGCDVFIAGESDDYGFRFAAECGIPMIETSHEVSENPGLAHFAKMLAECFPEIEVEFYRCPLIWRVV